MSVIRSQCQSDKEYIIGLRNEFAAAALRAGLDASFLETAMTEEECELRIKNAAVLSYKLADAMLAESNK